MDIKLKELYTVPEVASILDVSEKSIRDFINAGELKAVKVGQWRISRESIEGFMEARSNHYVAKARSEIQNFLDNRQSLKEGEERTLIVKEYQAQKSEMHGPYVSTLIQRLPEGSNIRWRFFFDEELTRARHIFTGDYQIIASLIEQLDRKLKEE